MKGGNMAEVKCNRTYVCAECGKARCAEHGDESFEEVDGRLLCEDCAPAELD